MGKARIVIIGAGGHGREFLDVINAVNASAPTWDFAGFVDDQEPDMDILGRLGARWLGTVDEFVNTPSASHYVIGIAEPVTRRRIADQLDGIGMEPATLIHSSAAIGNDVVLGPGTVVCSHVSITTNIRLGRHVHVNRNSTIGHDCRIGDFVTFNPAAVVSGYVTLDDDVTMGTHSAILQGLRVRRNAYIGAGAVVVRDVEPGTTVVGIPARPLQT